MSLTNASSPTALNSLLTAPGKPSLAYMFPGQGAQRVGMARDAYDRFASAREVFETADAVLESPISAVCFEGPEDSLLDTSNAQPAILTSSLAYMVAGLESGLLKDRPSHVAGHSLGQYTALVAAGSLSIEDAVRLVRARGKLMAQAGKERPGQMAAVLGLDEATVLEICEETGAEPANFNGPTQVVVGGTPESVEKASAATRGRGGKVLPVKVAGAFHTSLMASAAEQFASELKAVSFVDPAIPVVSNVTALPLTTAAEVTDDLALQIAKPVQWSETMSFMLNAGVQTFVEFGPGRTLGGMLKRISTDATIVNIDTVEALSAVVDV
jgi:[acyl-carrier-protein] S-malonyltransferase